MKPALALTVDVDGFARLYAMRGWKPPPGARPDAAYELALPRLQELLAERRLRATFFVVGDDLDREVPARAVARLAAAGHEIANHSLTHRLMTALKREEIIEEIDGCHARIARITGRAPVGFRAPGWAAPSNLTAILLERGYRYDASPFPSPPVRALTATMSFARVLWPPRGGGEKRDRESDVPPPADLSQRMRRAWSSWAASRRGSAKDDGLAAPVERWTTELLGPRRAWVGRDGLVRIPTLTVSALRVPLWGSVYLGFRLFHMASVVGEAASLGAPAAWVMHDWELLDFERLGDERFGYKPGSGLSVPRRIEATGRLLDALGARCRLVTAAELATEVEGNRNGR